MIVISKFEKLYLLRKAFLPIICIGLSILLLDVKFYYKKDVDIISPVFFLLTFGCLVLFYNLNSIYKLILEEKTMTRINLLSGKKESISYTSIISSNKEFVEGSYMYQVGQITSGYYRHRYVLESNKQLIVSPLYFENYNQIIKEINFHIDVHE